MRKYSFFVRLDLVAFLLLGINSFAQSGALDLSFDPGLGADNTIYATVIQSDGKILIGGSFLSFNGTALNRIARLNDDGTPDTTFNSGNGANNTIKTIAVQDNGKIIIGGNFTNYNGSPINRIVRLNFDGSVDTTFNPGLGANGQVNAIAIQRDGKILLGGGFMYFNTVPISGVVRLNYDGSLDNSFSIGTGPNATILSLSIQDDNKIIIGGDFIDFNGAAIYCIARLDTTGSLDNSFNPGMETDAGVRVTTVQPDGKIIVCGQDTTYNPQFIHRIVRLNTDGTIDSSFNSGTGANDIIQSAALQSDGKIIVSGYFTRYGGLFPNRLLRLNDNGTPDTTFNTGIGADFNINNTAIQTDGKIIISGEFNSYDGVGRNRIARLDGDFTSSVSTMQADFHLHVFPNPSSGNFTLNCPKGMVRIFNSTGQPVLTEESMNDESLFDLSFLSDGVYVIVVQLPNNKIYTQNLLLIK